MEIPLPFAKKKLPEDTRPKTVLGVQPVQLALVSYVDDSNQLVVQLAVVGDNNVHMIESRALGLSKSTTPQGQATKWLRDGIFNLLGKKVPE